MHTVIGQRLRSSPGALAAAGALGVAVVAADLALVCWNRYPQTIEGRGVLAVIVLAAYIGLVDGDLASVGLRLSPAQGWRRWIAVSLGIGLVVLACIAAGLGAWVLSGRELPIYATAPDDLGGAFLTKCLAAPVLEEVVYRLAPCMPLAVLLGPWKAIAVSGLAFAGLHVAYGNPSPENLVGGFFLAWAYLRSESLVLPMLLHGLGNLFVLAAQVVVWHGLHGAA